MRASSPAPKPVPGSPADNWSLRILETKDNPISALAFLRIAYNEMLAGRPVKAADEILGQVEAILRNDEKIPAHGCCSHQDRSLLPEAKRKVLLLFPAV
jgi:hypothetical protein